MLFDSYLLSRNRNFIVFNAVYNVFFVILFTLAMIFDLQKIENLWSLPCSANLYIFSAIAFVINLMSLIVNINDIIRKCSSEGDNINPPGYYKWAYWLSILHLIAALFMLGSIYSNPVPCIQNSMNMFIVYSMYVLISSIELYMMMNVILIIILLIVTLLLIRCFSPTTFVSIADTFNNYTANRSGIPFLDRTLVKTFEDLKKETEEENKNEGNGEKDEKETVECPICLSNFAEKDKIRELPCKHFFHMECIDEWYKKNSKCPLCRNDLSQKKEEDHQPNNEDNMV